MSLPRPPPSNFAHAARPADRAFDTPGKPSRNGYRRAPPPAGMPGRRWSQPAARERNIPGRQPGRNTATAEARSEKSVEDTSNKPLADLGQTAIEPCRQPHRGAVIKRDKRAVGDGFDR